MRISVCGNLIDKEMGVTVLQFDKDQFKTLLSLHVGAIACILIHFEPLSTKWSSHYHNTVESPQDRELDHYT